MKPVSSNTEMNCGASLPVLFDLVKHFKKKKKSFCLFCNKWLCLCDNIIINNVDLWNNWLVNKISSKMFVSSKAEVFMISSSEWCEDAFIVKCRPGHLRPAVVIEMSFQDSTWCLVYWIQCKAFLFVCIIYMGPIHDQRLSCARRMPKDSSLLKDCMNQA